MPSTWNSSNAFVQSVSGRSTPSLETMRPSLNGYSRGCFIATKRMSRLNGGIAKPVVQRTVALACSSACSSAGRIASSSAFRGAR